MNALAIRISNTINRQGAKNAKKRKRIRNKKKQESANFSLPTPSLFISLSFLGVLGALAVHFESQ
jgi:hypothetical protein